MEAIVLLGEPRPEISVSVENYLQAMYKLQEREERFRAIAEAAPIPILISRVSDGTILYANTHV